MKKVFITFLFLASVVSTWFVGIVYLYDHKYEASPGHDWGAQDQLTADLLKKFDVSEAP